MDWDRLKTFYHVATAGSISRAMDTIHLSQSAITRQIQSLEHSLKTKLFKRHTKGCLLYTSPSPRDLSTSRMPSSA